MPHSAYPSLPFVKLKPDAAQLVLLFPTFVLQVLSLLGQSLPNKLAHVPLVQPLTLPSKDDAQASPSPQIQIRMIQLPLRKMIPRMTPFNQSPKQSPKSVMPAPLQNFHLIAPQSLTSAIPPPVPINLKIKSPTSPQLLSVFTRPVLDLALVFRLVPCLRLQQLKEQAFSSLPIQSRALVRFLFSLSHVLLLFPTTRPSLPIDGHSSLTPIEATFQSQPSPHCATIRLGLGRRRASCHPHGPQETRECHVFLFQYPFPFNRQRHYAFSNFPPQTPHRYQRTHSLRPTAILYFSEFLWLYRRSHITFPISAIETVKGPFRVSATSIHATMADGWQ